MVLSDLIDKRLNSEQDYMALLDVLFKIVQANKGPIYDGDDGRLWHAEGLAMKLMQHATSLLYLSRETSIPDFPSSPLRFVDQASIDVLVRAAYETYLVFHYIYSAPKSKEEKDFRYWLWKAAGLAERQLYPATEKEHTQKQADEKRELLELRGKLLANSCFRELSSGKRRKFLSYLEEGRGDWKTQSWREIAESAGLSHILSSTLYHYLCGYAHSGFISVVQIKQPAADRTKPQLMRGTMLVVNIATANLINEFCELMPRAKSALEADTEGQYLVLLWVGIGRQVYENSTRETVNG